MLLFMRNAEQDDRLVGCDEPRRLLRDRARHQHRAGGDGGLRFLPAREEAPSHEFGIEPTADPDAQLAAFLSDFLPEDFLSDVDVLASDFLEPDFPAPPREGVTFLAAAVARFAVLPACVLTPLAVLDA